MENTFHQRYSEKLWNQIIRRNHFTEAEEKVLKEAYDRCPRHLFIPCYIENNLPREFAPQRERDWSVAYADEPVLLFDSREPRMTSTISQPTFVFYMLSLLQLKPGDNVLELGTGSGWNAALMAHIVDPGHVVTFEIIEEMAHRAARCMEEQGITNVTIVPGDGMADPGNHGPFTKGIFTASASDFPAWIYEKMLPGGRFFTVFNVAYQLDLGMLLEKVGDHFESRTLIPCAFVPVTGAKKRSELSERSEIREKLEYACFSGRDQLFRLKVAVFRTGDADPEWIKIPHICGGESTFYFDGLHATGAS